MLALAIALPILALLLIFNLTGIFHREKGAYALGAGRVYLAEAAEPIELCADNQRAVLFIHGFTASPAHLRDIAERAHQEGYDVFVPLLPGHGTAPQDIIETNFNQYATCLQNYYLKKRLSYTEFHLVGSSLGGVLALYLAASLADTDYRPSSVSTIGTPLFLFAPWRGILNFPLVTVARLVGLFVQSIGARVVQPNDKAQLPADDGAGRFAGYRGQFPRQGYSLLLGIRRLRRRLPLIDEPLYVFHAREDKIASYRNAAYLMRHVSSPLIRHWAANMAGFSHHCHDLLLYDSQRINVWNEVLGFFEETESCDPDLM
jgi:carboxylesterase